MVTSSITCAHKNNSIEIGKKIIYFICLTNSYQWSTVRENVSFILKMDGVCSKRKDKYFVTSYTHKQSLLILNPGRNIPR
jgi:ABC-type nitrate/sulfonate/bicarbonate transport system ATPase subunit